ncbi:Zn-dependent oxidoreductase [Uliginosibacterium sp. sgz301328]|uniref:Zn-dependent oxidoreductase n=1 Tax=Uliginosibacterium sp. sgz301328 TaxID=3243764 RepID=UPI00359E9E83
MLSIVVEEPGKLVIAERPDVPPAPGEVRIRVRAAGICGSDLHIHHGRNPFAVYPRVVGHEFFGHIDAVGDGVSPDRVGQRVVVDPVISCGECYPCSVGRSNVCTRLQVIGVHRDGGFSQYACVPARNAFAVPSDISDRHATTIEPYAVAANVTHRTGADASDIALVYGAGPAGLTVIDVLKNVFGATVIATDRLDERLDIARQCGADHVINTARDELPATLERMGCAPTLIIDAVCHPSILEEAVRIASPAARIGLLGFSSEATALVQQEMTRRELSLFASRLNNNMFPRVIEWMRAGRLHPDRLISHVLDYRSVEQAFALIETQPHLTRKVLLDLTR